MVLFFILRKIIDVFGMGVLSLVNYAFELILVNAFNAFDVCLELEGSFLATRDVKHITCRQALLSLKEYISREEKNTRPL